MDRHDAISSRTTSGSSRCSTACTRARSVSRRVVRLDGDRLGADHRARVDALVDPVDGRRGLGDSGGEDVLDRVSCPGTPAAAPSGCSRRAGRTPRRIADGAGACSRRGRASSTPCVAEASARAPRRAPRGSRSRPRRTSRSAMPAASARASARRPARFDATATIGRPASMSAWRFVPSPLTSTPIMRRSTGRRSSPASMRPITRSPGATSAGGHDGAVADAEVENPPQLVLADAVLGEPAEHRRALPGRRDRHRSQHSGKDAREVPGDAAARDVRERAHVGARAERADVVEVADGRRQQQLRVERIVADDAAGRARTRSRGCPPTAARGRRRRARPGVRRSARRAGRRRRRCRRSRARPPGRCRAARPSRLRGSRSRPRGTRPRRPRRARRPARDRSCSRRRSRGRTAGRRRS